MWHVMLYLASLLGTVTYSFVRGGTPERLAAGVMLSGTVLTIAVQAHLFRGDFSGVETGVLLIDAGALAVVLTLALVSSRFWPLWLAALMMVQVASHLPRLIGMEIQPFAYAVVLALWAYPMLIVILVGAWRHHRRRRLTGADPSWATSLTTWMSQEPHSGRRR